MPYSKTDQEGKGRIKPIAKLRNDTTFGPVLAVKAWLAATNLTQGPLFRSFLKSGKLTTKRLSASGLYNLIKRYTFELGYELNEFSPHSLRAGFITSAVQNKASIDRVRGVSFHASLKSLEPYIQHANRFENHP